MGYVTIDHDLATRTAMAAGLGLVAAAGNLLGGYFVVRKDWPRQYLQYFLALGAGYMLAVAFLEIIPESISLAGQDALCSNTRSRHIFILAKRLTRKKCRMDARKTA
jgi:zinc transporter ZupT